MYAVIYNHGNMQIVPVDGKQSVYDIIKALPPALFISFFTPSRHIFSYVPVDKV